MNDTTQTLIRSVVKLASGALVAHGITDHNNAETICAGVSAALAVLWGVLHRRAPKQP